ncbi:bifunctional apoptosis regulator-like [Carassius auratus]|uniref:Bifunctional apoptosis regulator-like n=1 Tax=Carassius auratus TaxID=7957 RepID=A0A6P6PK35_CARAU|nr:bifunctional apoptosis regulator-like [Carassius auratus]
MDVQIPVEPELSESESEEGTALSESEFTCHCCYQVLVDPTTLTCGHSFCRHCLANWWASALPRVRRDCPECRAVWTGFPRVNILLRLDITSIDEDLSAAPFSIRNESHRQIILEELHRLRQRRVSLNLWQYKDLYLGKSLFLLISLRNFPRLTLLYLFLFDYDDTFLPFIHTSCPATPDAPTDTPLNQLCCKCGRALMHPVLHQDWPGWRQWAEFLLMYFLLPYQLLSAVAWHWMSVHYWTAGFIIAHAALLTVLDVCFYWTLWKRGQMRTLPKLVWLQMFAVLFNTSLFVLPWPMMPLFIINTEIYIQLYFNPFLTAVLVKRTLLPTNTQHRP